MLVTVRRVEDVSVAPDTTVALQSRFIRDLPELGVRWQAETFPDLTLLTLNEPLAGELGLDAAWPITRSAATIPTLRRRQTPTWPCSSRWRPPKRHWWPNGC